MMELDELMLALNWRGVYQGRDCLVVRFDVSEASMINGLRTNDQCYYLEHLELQGTLVSFQVTDGQHKMVQYYVMNDRLHRSNGPAKIVRDEKMGTTVVEHYYNGLKHFDGGPAVIELTGCWYQDVFPDGEVVDSDYTVEVWEELTAYWFTFGEPTKYPAPHSMLCQNGYRIYRTTSSPVLDDYKDRPAFYAEKMFGNWNRENSALDDDPFRLRWINANGYSRFFTNGIPSHHRCDLITQIEWVLNGELIKSTDKSRERIRDNLFSEFNVWEGPLFPNQQETIFAFSEVSHD